jgi:preprotein translocase subunit SecE
MAKNEAIGGFWVGLLSSRFYKRTQGKRVRQLTAGMIIVWAAFGCWTLSQGPLVDSQPSVRVALPTVIAIVTAWLAFRLVNIPQFADFLIGVEAEMRKVSWPSLQECFRAGAVVIVVMFLLAGILFLYDQLWMRFFQLIGVLRI